MSSFDFKWESEIISGKSRGSRLWLSMCYPDTNVLVYAFLQNPSASSVGEIKKIKDAKKFFEIYDGPKLLTSPIVLAEFVDTATDPSRPFKMSPEDAFELVGKIFSEEKFSLVLPKIKLHNSPALSLPFFNYSIRLDGEVKRKDGFDPVDMTIVRGVQLRGASGSVETSLAEKHLNATWEYITMGSALYDLLFSATIDSNLNLQKPHKLVDTLVLSFGRGLGHVDFITFDTELINKAGPKPYRDVAVYELSDYLKNYLGKVDGSFKN